MLVGGYVQIKEGILIRCIPYYEICNAGVFPDYQQLPGGHRPDIGYVTVADCNFAYIVAYGQDLGLPCFHGHIYSRGFGQ